MAVTRGVAVTNVGRALEGPCDSLRVSRQTGVQMPMPGDERRFDTAAPQPPTLNAAHKPKWQTAPPTKPASARPKQPAKRPNNVRLKPRHSARQRPLSLRLPKIVRSLKRNKNSSKRSGSSSRYERIIKAHASQFP